MPESHGRRRAVVRSYLRDGGLDALLVTNLRNIRYLTGFTGSNAALLIHVEDEPGREQRTMFCTDGRYDTQSQQQVPDLIRIIDRACDQVLARYASDRAMAYGRLGFEGNHVTVNALARLAKAGPEVGFHATSGVVERARLIKDEQEIATLRAACAAGDQALADLIAAGGLRPGRTERDVANDLETRMREHGATDRAFDSIVAAGPHSAIPHHQPTDTPLRTGDFVKLDFGALVDGYHSDMTRTLVLGQPAEWQRDLYELVAVAQAAGRAAVRAGAAVADVDAAARNLIAAAGYGEYFLHPLGHGVGLDIHEAPLLAGTADATLSPGMTVTVEPGVYLAGQGGVRIEDTLVVREDEAELLTLTTRELLVV